MDLIDIAADVIRERDQLKARVRELEAAKAKYENMLSALLIHGQPKGELEERIAKAREMLQDTDWSGLEADLRRTIKQVWEALEGK